MKRLLRPQLEPLPARISVSGRDGASQAQKQDEHRLPRLEVRLQSSFSPRLHCRPVPCPSVSDNPFNLRSLGLLLHHLRYSRTDRKPTGEDTTSPLPWGGGRQPPRGRGRPLGSGSGRPPPRSGNDRPCSPTGSHWTQGHLPQGPRCFHGQNPHATPPAPAPADRLWNRDGLKPVSPEPRAQSLIYLKSAYF